MRRSTARSPFRLRFLALVTVLFSLVAAPHSVAQSPATEAQFPPPKAAGAEDALRAAERGTVRVIAVYLDEAGDIADISFGSGFVVAPERVVTNAHVVSVNGDVAPLLFVVPDRGSGGVRVRAEAMDGSQDFDLALLAAPGLVAPALPVSTSIPSKSRVVHALGYPGVTDAIRQLPFSEIVAPAQPYVTPGSIALISQSAPGGMDQPTIFHTAAVNPGNSGGPLVDECGRVVGINTWSAAATLSDAGVSAPAGQSVAGLVQTLLPILKRAGVEADVQGEACAPPLDPALQARLDAADRAMAAAARAQTSERQHQVAAVRAQRRLGEAVGVGAALLMLLAGVGALLASRSVLFRPVHRPVLVVAAAMSAVVAAGTGVWLLPRLDDAGREPSASAAIQAPSSGVGAPEPAKTSAHAVAPVQPSFDCTKAKSYSEKEICRDPALAARDAALGKSYAAALVRGPRDAVRAVSRQRWLERERCQDNSCVVAWFDRREIELQEPRP